MILASVAINLSLGNNSIFNRAKYARDKYINTKGKEELELAKVSNEMDLKFVETTRDGVTLTEEQYNALITRIGNIEQANTALTTRITTLEGKSSEPKFINTSNVLRTICDQSASWITSGTTEYSYTATQDCYVCGWIANYSANKTTSPGNSTGITIAINNVDVGRLFHSNSDYSTQIPINYFIKKGDTIKITRITGGFKGVVKAYGVK